MPVIAAISEPHKHFAELEIKDVPVSSHRDETIKRSDLDHRQEFDGVPFLYFFRVRIG